MAPVPAAASSRPWLPATARKLPRWRGFNLLEKFNCGGGRRAPYREEDFRLIARFGFDFVRLPMDYRCLTAPGDWERFDEEALKEVDQAVDWGRRYGVHVCLNLHRAPGYTVAKPPEARSLWTDPEAQRVCAKHWAMLARRYKGIPNERLSFNLLNEPPDIDPRLYAAVIAKLVAAVRAQDPGRLVIADGLAWGSKPVYELTALGVAEATRGYYPLELSHYQARWVHGERFPWPTWPRVLPPHGTLYGPQKAKLAGPMTVTGPFPPGARLRLRVQTVSDRATLSVAADGREAWARRFVCGPGAGEWKEAVYQPRWRIYQNRYDEDFEVPVPAGTRMLVVRVTDGDWLRLSELGLRAPGSPESALALDPAWGKPPEAVAYTPSQGLTSMAGVEDRRWLLETHVRPWQEAERAGIGVIVGEWGAFNKTPHDVTLRWMEDALKNWKDAGWGWALWNFRGPFGVLDSERADVRYEDYEGHKLDRRMLELLKRY